jgi:phosphoglycolate phosphatase
MTSPELAPQRVRAVVFDLDGTLVDSFDAIAAALNHARTAVGLTALEPAEIRRHVGRGLERLVRDLVDARDVDAAAARFREHYARVYLASTRALPGADATLRKLRARGLRVGVASNKPARFSGPILDHLGLGRWVEDLQGPDTAGAPKPDPAMLRRSMGALGVAADELLYVGDMALDLETASEAGTAVVLVELGSADPEGLGTLRQGVLPDLAALPPLLGC